MDNRPRPDTMAEWIGRENYERDRAPRGGGMGPTTVIATVVKDATTRVPLLLLDDGVTKLPIAGVPRGYIPLSGDVVAITRSKGGWVILELLRMMADYPTVVTVPLENAWALYSEGADTYQQFGDNMSGGAALLAGATASALSLPFNVAMSRTGIVKVNGLVRLANGQALTGANLIIGHLPPAMWPARSQMFLSLDGNNTIAEVFVSAIDGAIRVHSAASAGYITLQNITFRAKGYGTFVPLVFANGSASYNGSMDAADVVSVKTAGYTYDDEGVIVFEGAFSGGTVTANTNLQQITDTHVGSSLPMHFGVATSAGLGVLRYGAASGGSGSSNWLNILAANATWTSLAGIVMAPTPIGFTWRPGAFLGAWVNYNAAGYANYEMAKTPSGIAMSHGLLATGALGASFGQMPTSWRPKYQQIIAGVANSALSRLDFNVTISPAGRRSGQNEVTSGSNVWASIDGICWVPDV